jgi:tetratricopeptide (TPR) repeat protein
MNYEDIPLPPPMIVFQIIAQLCNLLPLLAIVGFFGYQWFTVDTIRRAKKLFLKGDLTGAKAALNRLLSISPRNADGYYGRGMVELTLGNQDAAIADYSRAVVRKPKNTEFRCARATAYQLFGESESAIADFDEALRLDPENLQAYTKRGSQHEQRGECLLALDDYNHAIEWASKYATKAKKFTPYMMNRQNVHALESLLADARIRRGHCYRQMGDEERACADFAAADSYTPNEMSEYLVVAQANYSAGRFEQSLACYNAMLKQSPDFTLIRNDRGETYFALGRYDGALADFKRVYAANPEYVHCLAGLAITYHVLNRGDEARRLWAVLLEKDARFNDSEWVKQRLNWAEPLVAEARRLIASFEPTPETV